MSFSPKQQEYFRKAVHRWNIKSGATRSGKTFMDYYVIPKRIRAVAGKDGLNVILGNTKGTLQRNIIEPLQKIWTDKLVSDIHSDNTAMLFGEKCYCLGADKISQVDRIRGSSIKYCYGDEIVTWNEEVFGMLKTRLDKPYSRFDGTCNPDNPNHWFKKFLDSREHGTDIYLQEYTIYDNPFLTQEFVRNLESELQGTVFFDRYILGKWKRAEGVIYKEFADNPADFIIDKVSDDIIFCTIGMDFGGNGSAHAAVCTGFTKCLKKVVVLDEYYRKEIISPAELEKDICEFICRCQQKYKVYDMYCDSAEQVLIKGIKSAADRQRIPINIHNARKSEIIGRIRFFSSIMAQKRFFVMQQCSNLIEAMQSAVWDSKITGKDVRLDDGKYNIDSLDALEYSVEPFINNILEMR